MQQHRYSIIPHCIRCDKTDSFMLKQHDLVTASRVPNICANCKVSLTWYYHQSRSSTVCTECLARTSSTTGSTGPTVPSSILNPPHVRLLWVTFQPFNDQWPYLAVMMLPLVQASLLVHIGSSGSLTERPDSHSSFQVSVQYRFLELLWPLSHLPLWLFEALNPLKCCMVCANQERTSGQVATDVSHRVE